MSVFTPSELAELRRSSHENFIIEKVMFMTIGSSITSFFLQNRMGGYIALAIMAVTVTRMYFRHRADMKMLDRIFAEKEAIREP